MMDRDTQALIERLRSMARHEHDDLSIGDEAADALERLSGERAAIVAYLREKSVPLGPDFWLACCEIADAIEQGLHHRAQALADLAEGDADLIGDSQAGSGVV